MSCLSFPLATTERIAKVKQRPKGYWREAENRTQFFKEFAEAAGFDMWDTEKWKTVSETEIVAKKVLSSSYLLILPSFLTLKQQGGGLLRLYKGSLLKALQGTFPDVAWQGE